ncbi:PHF5-like [Hexamita inflata]|uniref:PHF5-like n=1 Tax=Hexamita inflata TaxID=28002 RepID=A0AA86TV48_9EUKA|nr:PHF5-like [Hexamita inflata]
MKCQEFAPHNHALACERCSIACVYCGSPDSLDHPVFICENHLKMSEKCCKCGRPASFQMKCCKFCKKMQLDREGCVWVLDIK